MSKSMAGRNRFLYWTLKIRYLSEAVFDLLKMSFLFIQAICNIEYYSRESFALFKMPLYSSRHIFVIYMPLFNSILLQYWKQSSQPLTTFWILLFLHCLKNLRHTELAARLWGCFFTLKYICTRAVPPSPLTIQTRAPCSCKVASYFWAAGAEGPLVMPLGISLLSLTLAEQC